MQRFKKVLFGLGFAIMLLGAAERSQADEAVYRKTSQSTVMFLFHGRPIGSGVLIDVENRIVATAEHVVAAYGANNIEVAFAELNDNGDPITSFTHYRNDLARHAIPAKVLDSNKQTDLALVQLERLPEGARAIPLANRAPAPGMEVHVVGHSDIDKGMVFSYCQGYVRNSADAIRGMMIHHTPTNRGDSGGPIVNSNGELVGLVSNGTTGGPPIQVRDHAVGLAHIQAMLKDVLEKLTAAH